MTESNLKKDENEFINLDYVVLVILSDGFNEIIGINKKSY